MLHRVLTFSMVVVLLFVSNSAYAQSYGVDDANWKSHVDGMADETEFCPSDTLNSKTSIKLDNSAPGTPVDVRVESWIDGGSHFDSGTFQMTGACLTYTVDRSLVGTAATHLIKCKVTFSDNGTRIGTWSTTHTYTRLDPEDCPGVK